MKWEYKTEPFKWDDHGNFRHDEVGSSEFLQGTLTRLGKEGWELVSFATPNDASIGIAVLKRPILDAAVSFAEFRPLEITAD